MGEVAKVFRKMNNLSRWRARFGRHHWMGCSRTRNVVETTGFGLVLWLW